MLSSVLKTLILLALAAAPSVVAQQPSGVPACTYTCPPSDSSGFALDPSASSMAGGKLACSYPPTPGDTDFYCSYDEATGELTEDHNAGLCKVAQQSCGASGRRKRWDNFSAVKEKAAKRAAAPRSTGPQAVSAWKMVRKRVADVDA